MFTLPWRRTRDINSGTTAPDGLPLPEGAGRAECQVVDPVGLPMQATVTVLDRAGQPVTEGGTDAYGLFTAAIPPGDYQLSVVCEGFQPHRVPVQVFPGARASAGAIGLVAAPIPPAPAPGRWDIDPHHSAVRFIARHIGLAPRRAVTERDAKAGTQRIQHRSGCAQHATVGPGLTHAHW
ncbi:carboxypeptidase-like regulatory domain-containing protein [Streptomyces sp. NPDC056227]|uniref:carboxypeptidase-like regulatory domain-containing protein n=1 Tax=Streptomyces sp. NPDC056227 TaxID=3345753 RepID=UPI0035E1693F